MREGDIKLIVAAIFCQAKSWIRVISSAIATINGVN
jgi:hypothetical protein